MSFVVEPQQAKKPGQRLTRVLVAAAVVLVVSPLAWMAMSHLTISKSLNHVQVRLNFAALIDWSSEGPRLGEGTCAQVRALDPSLTRLASRAAPACCSTADKAADRDAAGQP